MSLLRKRSISTDFREHFVEKNIFFNHYLNLINNNLNKSHKKSIFDYILFICFVLMIIKEIICLQVIDRQTRIYLLDITLFLGGIRQYNAFVFILMWFCSLYSFKHIHLTKDKNLMQWVEVLEIINGTVNTNSITIIDISEQELKKFRMFASWMFNFSFVIIMTFSKLTRLKIIVLTNLIQKLLALTFST